LEKVLRAGQGPQRVVVSIRRRTTKRTKEEQEEAGGTVCCASDFESVWAEAFPPHSGSRGDNVSMYISITCRGAVTGGRVPLCHSQSILHLLYWPWLKFTSYVCRIIVISETAVNALFIFLVFIHKRVRFT
jgi:hypothetical protein